MSGCNSLLSSNTYNKDSALVADPVNLANFSKRISTVLSCAQKIIPGQGEAVVFEKPNFDSTGKVFFYKINADNSPGKYTSDLIQINSMIVGPFTNLYLFGGGLDKNYPIVEHKAKEEVLYYAQVTNTPETLPQTPNKIYGLTSGTIKYNGAVISMANCYTTCDDGALQSNSNMCLSGFRQCVKDKIGTNNAAV